MSRERERYFRYPQVGTALRFVAGALVIIYAAALCEQQVGAASPQTPVAAVTSEK